MVRRNCHTGIRWGNSVQRPNGSSLTRFAIPFAALMVCCVAFAAGAAVADAGLPEARAEAALAPASQSSAGERRLELIAVDERAGRAVLIDATGATHVLQLRGPEIAGIRLRAVAGDTALFDVHDAAADARFAYRLVIGEAMRVRGGAGRSETPGIAVASPGADDRVARSPPRDRN
jgi:hypothetical protein